MKVIKKTIVILVISVLMCSLISFTASASIYFLGFTGSATVAINVEDKKSTNVGVTLSSYEMTETQIKNDVAVSSSNPDIVSVSGLQKGTSGYYVTVTPKKAGNATIKIQSKSDNTIFDDKAVTVAKQAADPMKKEDIEALGKEQDDNFIDSMVGFLRDIVEFTSGMVNIKAVIINSGSDISFFTADQQSDVVNSLLNIFQPIAYAILIIVWAINMGQKSITLDLYDGKGFIKACSRLIVGMLFISISLAIFKILRQIEITTIAQIFSAGDRDISYTLAMPDLTECYDNTWIIGKLITICKVWWKMPKALIIGCVNSIVYIILEIVIVFRAVKICIYQGAAPVFFGLFASDDTASIGKNYILQYIRLLAQGIVMAIVFYVYQKIFYSSVLDTVMRGDISLLTMQDFSIHIAVTILLPFMLLSSEKLVDKMIGRS